MAGPLGRYDGWRGQLRLYDPLWLPLDDEITASVRGPSRPTSLDADAGYTLLAFARRAAVFAMRRRDPEPVVDGLAAAAASDPSVVDERDTLLAVALLRHAAVRIGADRDALAGPRTASDPSLAELVDGLRVDPPDEDDVRDRWGHVEVAAPGGPGLLQWGLRHWEPRMDLTLASTSIADAISEMEYQADDPMLAGELPEVWLKDAGDQRLGPALRSSRGTAVVHGRLRPEVHDEHASQQLTIWVVEASDAATATRLRSMAEIGNSLAASLGVATGPLFALAIARSFVRDRPSFETTESLRRFEGPLLDGLAAAGPEGPGEGV